MCEIVGICVDDSVFPPVVYGRSSATVVSVGMKVALLLALHMLSCLILAASTHNLFSEAVKKSNILPTDACRCF